MKILNILYGCMIVAFVIIGSLFFMIYMQSEMEFQESIKIVENGGVVNVSNNLWYGDYSKGENIAMLKELKQKLGVE